VGVFFFFLSDRSLPFWQFLLHCVYGPIKGHSDSSLDLDYLCDLAPISVELVTFSHICEGLMAVPSGPKVPNRL
jgi:hypothetical protein